MRNKRKSHLRKHWIKWTAAIGIAITAIIAAVVDYETKNFLEWWHHEHLINDQELSDVNRWHWEIPKMESVVSNLVWKSSDGEIENTNNVTITKR